MTVRKGVAVIKPSGSMAFYHLEDILEFIRKQIEQKNSRFIFDFSSIIWVDANGLGLIAMAVKYALTNRNRVCIVGPNDVVKNLLKHSRLIELVRIEDSMEEALKTFQTKGKEKK